MQVLKWFLIAGVSIAGYTFVAVASKETFWKRYIFTHRERGGEMSVSTEMWVDASTFFWPIALVVAGPAFLFVVLPMRAAKRYQQWVKDAPKRKKERKKPIPDAQLMAVLNLDTVPVPGPSDRTEALIDKMIRELIEKGKR